LQGRCRDAAPLRFYPNTKQATSAIASAWGPSVTTFKSGENPMRSLSSHTMLAAAGLMVFAAGSLLLAPDARAQGTNTGTIYKGTSGSCPDDWTYVDVDVRDYCRPFRNTNTPTVYLRSGDNVPCANGYYVDRQNAKFCTTRAPGPSREQSLGKGGSFAKPTALARCPTGWISTTTGKECYTQMENAPIVRAKGAKDCAAGELNDWDLWCTSNYEHLTKAWAERYGIEDFNKAYGYALGNRLDANAIPDAELSPAATAYFGGTTSTAAPAAAPAAPAAAKADECTTGSEVGEAIGGALGGRAGAALGGALGGLGKKKKKSGC
jgi:hypothetical protein